jgi:hypothetical protein
MPAEAPVSVLGGLPLIAEVSWSTDYFTGECDSSVDCLYWQKRDALYTKKAEARCLGEFQSSASSP